MAWPAYVPGANNMTEITDHRQRHDSPMAGGQPTRVPAQGEGEVLVRSGSVASMERYVRARVCASGVRLSELFRERLSSAWTRVGRPVCLLATGAVSSLHVTSSAGPDGSFVGWQVYSTERGDHRSIRLDDGSRIELNTDSFVHARFTESYRTVVLNRGEALFAVAPDEGRPFRVRAAGVVLRALDTEFAVRLRSFEEIDVLVTRGRVTVRSPNDWLTSFHPTLVAGQAVSVRRATMQVESLEVAEAECRLAWLQGRLVFRGTPLSEVVEEYNRYNRLQLKIGDPAITNLRIGGDFRATDVESFVRTLETVLDLHGVPLADDPADTPTLYLVGSIIQ